MPKSSDVPPWCYRGQPGADGMCLPGKGGVATMLRDTPGQAQGGESIPGAGVTPGTPKISKGAVGGLWFTGTPGCHLSWRGDSDTQSLTSCIFT